MRTRKHDYDSLLDSVEDSEGEVKDICVLPTILDDPPSILDPSRLSDCLGAWKISSFDNMNDRGGGSVAVRDGYSSRAEGIAFVNWKTRFKSWQRT